MRRDFRSGPTEAGYTCTHEIVIGILVPPGWGWALDLVCFQAPRFWEVRLLALTANRPILWQAIAPGPKYGRS
eukprot:953998-Rhodomonas_salina.2